MRSLPLVAQATPVIFNLMDLTTDVNALVYGWKADNYEFDALQILSGHHFQDGKHEVMLGDLLAEDIKKKVGDTLEIQGSPFTVCAISVSYTHLDVYKRQAHAPPLYRS